MTPTFPCGVYYKAVAKNHNAVCCDRWVHIKYNNLTKFYYTKMQEPWYCKNCIKQILPFWQSIMWSYKRKFKIHSKENNSG